MSTHVNDAREVRLAELEAIEQPIEVIEAGNGGDFDMAAYRELEALRIEMFESSLMFS